jgi:3-oxoacyl-[acyl-carrier-protein] synthase-3
MYIKAMGSYVPQKTIDNSYFSEITGLNEDWFLSRTGIQTRRKASSDENTNTLAIKAIKNLEDSSKIVSLQDIDLIVGATYTPYDTIHTLAHHAQKYLSVYDIPVVSISTACSSFINAIEIVEGYFAANKAENALVVASDHNTAYSDETDKTSGHLWGDGASAVVISKEHPENQPYFQILDIMTGGGGGLGKAVDSVFLRPIHEGFMMNNGRDVFVHACEYMASFSEKILTRNNKTIADVAWFIPHQANLRITQNVAENLGLPMEKVLSNIQYLGNTGCAGCAIALAENASRYKHKDLIVMSVFGGGYSYGSMLLEYINP